MPLKLSASPSIRRLPQYLHIIKKSEEKGVEYISGTTIAQELNLEPIQVRKDLSITGIIGKPKKGYVVVELRKAIERFLGWHETRKAILVGAGNLGTALLGYGEFPSHGLSFAAAFDADPSKAGLLCHDVPILAMDELESWIGKEAPKLAVLTVPSQEAQAVCDRVTGAGIQAIWNFTNVKLKVPGNVVVQREDLTSGWALLCAMLIKTGTP